MQRSAGMVPPPVASQPGRSLKTLYFESTLSALELSLSCLDFQPFHVCKGHPQEQQRHEDGRIDGPGAAEAKLVARLVPTCWNVLRSCTTMGNS